jgi:hypothetical protein
VNEKDRLLKGHKWAEPSATHLRQLMRYLYNNPEEGRKVFNIIIYSIIIYSIIVYNTMKLNIIKYNTLSYTIPYFYYRSLILVRLFA